MLVAASVSAAVFVGFPKVSPVIVLATVRLVIGKLKGREKEFEVGSKVN